MAVWRWDCWRPGPRRRRAPVVACSARRRCPSTRRPTDHLLVRQAEQAGDRRGRDPVSGALGEVRLGAAGAGHPAGGRLDQRGARPAAGGHQPHLHHPADVGWPVRRGKRAAGRPPGRRRRPWRDARWRPRSRSGSERAGRGQCGPLRVRGHHGQPGQLRPRHGGDRVAEGQRLRRRGAGAGRAAPLPARQPQPAGVQAGQEQDGRVHPPGDAELQQRPPDDPHPPDGGGRQRRHGHPGLGAGLGPGGAHQLQDAGAERGHHRLVQPVDGLQRRGRRRGRRGRRPGLRHRAGRAHRHQQHRRRHLPGAIRGRSVPPPG